MVTQTVVVWLQYHYICQIYLCVGWTVPKMDEVYQRLRKQKPENYQLQELNCQIDGENHGLGVTNLCLSFPVVVLGFVSADILHPTSIHL